MTAPTIISHQGPLKESWQKHPNVLAAGEPPEARGLTRDGVRLMVSRAAGDLITHARLRHFPEYLEAGDVVVVNTSATLNAPRLMGGGKTPVSRWRSTSLPRCLVEETTSGSWSFVRLLTTRPHRCSLPDRENPSAWRAVES